MNTTSDLDPPSMSRIQATTSASLPQNARKKPICRYYNSPKGCRAGDQCKFQHATVSPDPTEMARTAQTASSELADPPQKEGSQASVMSNKPRAILRPTPKTQVEDPRSFNLGQMQRRFNPTQSQGGDGSTILTFKMQPSDPDFPYDIEALECELNIPAAYPSQARPTLLVKNNDIPRGFQINIERGFDSIAADAPNATLLGLMNRLDRQLETILAGRIADTIKIVSNKDTTKKPAKQEPLSKEQLSAAATTTTTTITATATATASRVDIADEDLAVAQKKRQAHVRQLEARFSRLQPFAKAADGLSYTVPLDSPKRSLWPEALRSVRAIQILVPQRYPIEPAEIHFENEGAEARAVETSFKIRSTEHPGDTLTQQINYLSQNLKDMSIVVPEQVENEAPKVAAMPEAKIPQADITDKMPSPEKLDQNTHVHYIPRPREWDGVEEFGDDSTDDESSSDPENTEEDVEETTELPKAPTSGAPAERGILLSFPHLELHGIELLELTSLNITVKCERCKDTMDISRLRSSSENSIMRNESCNKCAAGFAVRFRADMIHANSVRAGYLDLDGCTIVDMLPSNFLPTCSECSTSLPAPGVVAVRGDSAIAVCRQCHRKMSFRILEVKFLQVSASAARASLAPGRKKARENLGITAGTELPKQGRCAHYRKSYRWFRFSCCNKVFPCDRCHDDQSDHPNEWANRMLCGFCSREQNFRPDDCGFCHASVTGKRGTGFWEGGKGTRDPLRMSRKDPRKYKRRPGTKPHA